MEFIIKVTLYKTFFSFSRHKKSGNQELAANLAEWVLKMRGVLRAGAVTHHIVNNVYPPPAYTILDDVVSIVYL